jgi:CheY-like chemotaxis protein
MKTGTGTILVVEDDELVRRYAASQLVSLGYEVIEATSGPGALRLLEQDVGRRIDLLFTDVVMPGGMNGRVLADAARALRPEMPVLFTSGYTENAIVHHGRLDAGVQLLSKPYRRAELARRVSEILKHPASPS